MVESLSSFFSTAASLFFVLLFYTTTSDALQHQLLIPSMATRTAPTRFSSSSPATRTSSPSTLASRTSPSSHTLSSSSCFARRTQSINHNSNNKSKTILFAGILTRNRRRIRNRNRGLTTRWHDRNVVVNNKDGTDEDDVGFLASSPRQASGASVEGDYNADELERARDLVQSGSIRARFIALYKFTRPHTIRGTILGSIAGTIRALIDTPSFQFQYFTRWTVLLPRAFIGLFALLFGNAFIVGINQIYDKPIDEMNKPFLPIASGEMSIKYAWLTTLTSVILGPIIVYQYFPQLLFRLYIFGLFLGAIYSIPPIRTKRNPILAGLTIAIVRGFLLNFGVYYATIDALRTTSIGATSTGSIIKGSVATAASSSVPSFSWSPKVSFIARFMTLFATVIAVTKDLPDVEGDKAYQIETFATKMGVGKIALCATICLFMNYIHAIITSFVVGGGNAFNRIPMIGGHVTLAIILLLRYRNLNSESNSSIKAYYKHIWDLFYMEYVLYTLI